MQPAQSSASTNVARRHLSGTQAKDRLYSRGLTLQQFAKDNGFNYRTVSEVIRGVNKGLYGEGHRVAVALGMK